MFVLLALVIELCCRAYYYQALAPPKRFATAQLFSDLGDRLSSHHDDDLLTGRLEHNQYLVRPEASKADNDEIDRECRAANRAVFASWVEFAFSDFRSKYVNVVDHRRRSVPDRSDAASDSAARPFRIFFLGGSTMYGLDVTDAETIPSAFVRAYRQKFPGGRPIRVYNLGMPYYYSYQELILLSDRLFHNDRPDMIVMLDGLNDCFEAGAAIERAPVFAPRMQDRIMPGDVKFFAQQMQNYQDFPAGMSADSAASLVAARYLENIRNARDLAGWYHIPLYCFWQPVPYYDYPNQPNDPICTHARNSHIEKIYPIVRDSAAQTPYLTWLGDMLHDEKGLPFVDQLHYSPSFNRAIAEKILSHISIDGK